MKIHFIWPIGVVAWNFGFPKAQLIKDVIITILLNFLTIELKKSFKI
jgi:hypothetical protein